MYLKQATSTKCGYNLHAMALKKEQFFILIDLLPLISKEKSIAYNHLLHNLMKHNFFRHNTYQHINFLRIIFMLSASVTYVETKLNNTNDKLVLIPRCLSSR